MATETRVLLDQHELALNGLNLRFVEEVVGRDTDWSMCRPDHTMIVHLAGALDRMETALETLPLSPACPGLGDVWVVPATCRYDAQATGGTIRYCEITLPERLFEGRDMAPQTSVRDPLLHQGLRGIEAAVGSDDDLSGLYVGALAETVRLHIARGYLDAALEGDRIPVLNRRARRLLEEHIADRLDARVTLEELAQLVSLTPHELLPAFRAAFGTTPRQYIIDKRIALARQLLAGSHRPITRVALDAGFATPSQFSTTFRARVGMSPSAFRRAAR